MGEGVQGDLVVFAAACAGARVGLFAGDVVAGTDGFDGRDDENWTNGMVGIGVGNIPESGENEFGVSNWRLRG